MDTDKLLTNLQERLERAFGRRLVSIVLYGSAASGQFRERWSDLNVFVVVDKMDRELLAAAEPVIRWWRDFGQPAPLLMPLEEVAASTDCFPIEFHDMIERRRVLFGQDPLDGLIVDDSFYRAQVEHELRAKLIRLRQKAASAISDTDLLFRLMADSCSTFLVLARHALRLASAEAPHIRRDIASGIERCFGVDPQPFYTLLSLRENGLKPGSGEAGPLFDGYVAALGQLVSAVDKMEK